MRNVETILLTSLVCMNGVLGLGIPTKQTHSSQKAIAISRRDAAASIFSLGIGATSAFFIPAQTSNAAEDNQVLSDEEMAARIARKMELLQKSKGGGGGATGRATDIRSDVNPEAAVNLRSRSAIENAKLAMEKQKEMKMRDKTQKREDLCEMLGRGC